MALRNEINVAEVRNCNWLVGLAKVWPVVADRTDFILAIIQIFSLFYEALIFLFTSLHQGKEVNRDHIGFGNHSALFTN